MPEKVRITSTEVLSDNFFPLKKVKYEQKTKKGKVEELTREVYFSSNGVAVLLYNRQNNSVILTRQFRLPSYLNQNPTGMMTEVCAGIVEGNDDPAATAIREIEEETGFKIQQVQKIFEAFTSPGAVAERLHYFIAEYSSDQKISEGGGLEEENEEIEVLEYQFDEAYDKIESGEIKDAKTIILLLYAKINLFGDEGEKVFDIL